MISSPASAQADAPQEVDPTAAEDRWVDAFLQCFVDGKPDGSLIDEPRLVRAALKPFQLNARQLNTFDSAPVGKQLIQGVIDNAAGDSMLTYLRMREKDGQRFAIFHLRSDNGLTYYEWYLDKYPGDVVKAWDCEVYVSGERMSQTLRRLWTPAVASLDEEVRKHMGKRNRELAANMPKMTQLRQAYITQDYEQAIKLFESMPKSVQEERTMMSLVMTAYLNLGDDDRYHKLLEHYNELYGDSSSRELMMIDLCILREEYDKAIQMVDDLDQRVGGDHYLDVFRSNIVHMKGDYKKAKAFADRCIQNDPSIEDVYWTAIEQAIIEEDWKRISVMFDGLIAIDVEINDLTDLEYFAGYVKSGEYAAWLKKHKDDPAGNQN